MPNNEAAVDRRERRSGEVRQAMTYQLEHLADEYDIRNLALGDDRGILLACAGRRATGEALAAYAPVFRQKLEHGDHETIMDKLNGLLPGVDGQKLDVRRFDLQGEPHYLSVVGDEIPCRRVDLARAVTGIRRIVWETASTAA